MGFTRHDLLMAVIDDGITEIPLAYPRPDQAMKREGAIAGFEACRTLDDHGLVTLLRDARENTRSAMERRASDYWWHRMFEAQVEWTLNVLSAAMSANGLEPLTGHTARGMLKAADILGVGSHRMA